MLTVAVCDDEKTMRDYLTAVCRDFFAVADIEMKSDEFTDGDSLVKAYESGQASYDIILLDIKMKNTNGISAAKEIRRLGAGGLIVFITSSAEYVFRGYEVKAFRYILKTELATSFTHVMKECVNELTNKDVPTYSFSSGNDKTRIALSDIIYFESEKRKIKIHAKSAEYTFYEKLSSVEDQLKAKDFVRCHQSFLVNAKKIKSVSGPELTLTDGTVLPISKSKLRDTRDAFLWAMR